MDASLEGCLETHELRQAVLGFLYTNDHARIGVCCARTRALVWEKIFDAAELYQKLFEYLVDQDWEEMQRELMDEEFDRMWASPTPPSS